MDQKGGYLFSLLLSSLPPGAQSQLLNAVKEEDKKKIPPATQKGGKKKVSALLSFDGWSHKIHYSWIAGILKQFPEETFPLLASLFPAKVGEPLARSLNIHYKPPGLSRLGRAYLFSILKEKAIPKEVLPLELLPQKPLNFLLDCTKKEVVELINLLGVYDIVGELTRIVDRSLLQKIHEFLTPKQQEFLRKSVQKPMKWQPLPFHPEKYVGNPHKFHQKLHQRGLIRLSFALAEEEGNFLWHFLHLLDIGRAEFIEKERKKLPVKNLVSFFQEQVLEAYKELKL